MDRNTDLAAYLAGLFDGEGCVYHNGTGRQLVITNTDPSIIEHACYALTQLYIKYRVYKRRPLKGLKQCWTIYITHQRYIRSFAAQVPLQSRTKREKLNVLIDSYSKTRKVEKDSKWTSVEI